MAEPRNRYSTVSLTLHWLTAALILSQILLINAAEAEGADRALWMMLHKSGGMAILMLTLIRIGWRFANPALKPPAGMPRWEAWLAKGVHVLFYVLLLALPLTGWLAGSAAGRNFQFYGLFDFPLLPIGGGRPLAKTLMGVHETLPKLLYVLLALHVLGALKHQFVNRDNVLHRMIPLIPRRP
ncbi:cytochrome b [Brevundimonas goettingensis]|uniref:Cytochrome b n=1 Tax=Brevundimonas goettingensis TaxID=2774190 RepID=A0A975C7J4_9CAUL|nr:cytochrome b [Brevundimonas goettingensis]QTC92646.1 cytochrome b [Brevundimonas goettingensis]